MNFKEELFLEYLLEDCYLAVLAVLLVVMVVVFSHGFWLAVSLAIGMILSTGVAFFFYVVRNLESRYYMSFQAVLQIHFFPFINLLALLIAIAISFDNAFLLTFQYQQAIKEARYGLRGDVANTFIVII